MIQITNIPERREAVTAINNYDQLNGINPSQKAKYEKPVWFYVLACLGGNDRKPAVTIADIVTMLSYHNIHIGYQSIRLALRTLIHKQESIQPNRRNCGVGCYEAVSALGDIKVQLGTRVPNQGRGRPESLYWLGQPSQRVGYYKRVYNIFVRP